MAIKLTTMKAIAARRSPNKPMMLRDKWKKVVSKVLTGKEKILGENNQNNENKSHNNSSLINRCKVLTVAPDGETVMLSPSSSFSVIPSSLNAISVYDDDDDDDDDTLFHFSDINEPRNSNYDDDTLFHFSDVNENNNTSSTRLSSSSSSSSTSVEKKTRKEIAPSLSVLPVVPAATASTRRLLVAQTATATTVTDNDNDPTSATVTATVNTTAAADAAVAANYKSIRRKRRWRRHLLKLQRREHQEQEQNSKSKKQQKQQLSPMLPSYVRSCFTGGLDDDTTVLTLDTLVYAATTDGGGNTGTINTFCTDVDDDEDSVTDVDSDTNTNYSKDTISTCTFTMSSNNNNTTKNKTKQQQRSSSTRNGGHLEDDSISWWESSLSCGVLCVDTIVDIIGERTKNRGGASWGGGSGKVPESVSYCH